MCLFHITGDLNSTKLAGDDVVLQTLKWKPFEDIYCRQSIAPYLSDLPVICSLVKLKLEYEISSDVAY